TGGEDDVGTLGASDASCLEPDARTAADHDDGLPDQLGFAHCSASSSDVLAASGVSVNRRSDAPRRESTRMKGIGFLPIAAIALAGVIAAETGSSQSADPDLAAIDVGTKPAGYRDWRLISVAHEEGDLHSFAAVLGNDIA